MDEMGLKMKVQIHKLGVRGIELWRRENKRLVLKYLPTGLPLEFMFKIVKK